MKAAKERGPKVKLKNSEVKKLFETSSLTKEGMDYAVEGLEKFIKQTGLTEDSMFKKALAIFSDVAERLGIINADGNWWSGAKQSSGFQKEQQGLANASVDKINVEKPVTFNFAVSNDSEFIKNYTVPDNKGKPGLVDGSTEEAMDKQLRAWLAKNNWKTGDDGIIYELNDKGKVKTDDSGKPVKADPEEFKSKIEDPATGFKAFAQKANSSLQISTQERDYATQRAVEKAPGPSQEAGQSFSG